MEGLRLQRNKEHLGFRKACNQGARLAKGRCGRGAGSGSGSAFREAKDVVNGSGRVSGGAFNMDVQIGQPIDQAPATGGGVTLEGNSAEKL